MEITSLIHNDKYNVNQTMKERTIDYLRSEFFIQTRQQLENTELAVFLIMLGGSLLVWEEA